MFKFIARRVLETIPVLFIIITGSFFMIRLAPGGPFDSERKMPEEVKRNLDAYYGYDKPLVTQYLVYMGKLLHGDLGPSTKYASRTVNELIGESLPISLELGVEGILIAVVIGITAGITASLRPNTPTDYVPMTLAMIGVCMPTFVLGPLLVLFLALYRVERALSPLTVVLLVLLPALISGLALRSWWRGPADWLLGRFAGSAKASGARTGWHRYLGMGLGLLFGALVGGLLVLFFSTDHEWFNPSGWDVPADRVLPALTLGIYYAAYLARLTRGGMLEILSQDYIRTARAKGAGPLRVIMKHSLRGGLLPVVSFLGPALAGIISGSFVVESIFQIPGLGRSFVTSAFNRDHSMILGTVIFFAVLIIVFNLLVDVLQVLLNPRLRFD